MNSPNSTTLPSVASLRFDPTTRTHHVRWDADGTSSVIAVVTEAVAAVNGCDVLELDPLFEAVDPDFLATMVANRDWDAELTFAYEGHSVTVSSDGEVAISRLT
jgi:hypothetical protein